MKEDVEENPPDIYLTGNLKKWNLVFRTLTLSMLCTKFMTLKINLIEIYILVYFLEEIILKLYFLCWIRNKTGG